MSASVDTKPSESDPNWTGDGEASTKVLAWGAHLSKMERLYATNRLVWYEVSDVEDLLATFTKKLRGGKVYASQAELADDLTAWASQLVSIVKTLRAGQIAATMPGEQSPEPATPRKRTQAGNPEPWRKILADEAADRREARKAKKAAQASADSEDEPLPLLQDDGSVRVPIGGKYSNEVVLIDAADAELVGRYHWYIHEPRGRKYVFRNERGKAVYLHKLIAGDVEAGSKTYFRNGDTLDCRRSNIGVGMPGDYRKGIKYRSTEPALPVTLDHM